jgi:GT2 family glycosyltransferase
MSNSDAGSHFWGDVGFPVKHSIEGFKSHNPIQELDVVESFVTMRMPFLVRANLFCAFYCTMMSKSVWDEVGELDAAMDFRGNDWDYCIRAEKLGIPSMINLGAFALHFGDKTIPKCVTKEQLDECSRVFQSKWNGA